MSVTFGVSRAHARRILIGAAVLLSLGMGLRQSLGLFLTPVTRDLGLTATTFTLAVAIQNIVWGLSQAQSAHSPTAWGSASCFWVARRSLRWGSPSWRRPAE